MYLKAKNQPRQKPANEAICSQALLQSIKQANVQNKIGAKSSKDMRESIIANTRGKQENPSKIKVLSKPLKASNGNLQKPKVKEQQVSCPKPKKSVRSKDVFTRLYLNLYSQKSRHNRMVINSIREARMRELWETRVRIMEEENRLLLEQQMQRPAGDDKRSSKNTSIVESLREQSSVASSRLSRSDPLFRALEFSSHVKGFSISSGSADSNKDSSNDSAIGSKKDQGSKSSQVTTCCFTQMFKELTADLNPDPNSNSSSHFSQRLSASSRNHKKPTFAEDLSTSTANTRVQHTLISLLDQRTGQVVHLPCLDDADLRLGNEISSLIPVRNAAQDMDVETEDETVVVAQRNGYAALLQAVVMYQTGGAFVPGYYC